MRNQESVNVDSTQRNKKKDHLPEEPGPKTYVAALLAQQQTIMWKAVAGRPHLGVAAPLAMPTTSNHHVSSPGDPSMMVARVHARKSSPNRPSHDYI